MIFTRTKFEGVYLITPELKKDSRGYFTRIYCQREFKNQALHFLIVQMNQSKSARAGTIRGLHLQKAPHSEAKLIQCLRGSVFDVVVDLRRNSKTYGRWLGEILSEENKKMILVSRGFAHGYQALEDNSVIQYPVSEYYSPEDEIGIRWNDPFFRIEWPIKKVIVSEKDSAWPDFIPSQKA